MTAAGRTTERWKMLVPLRRNIVRRTNSVLDKLFLIQDFIHDVHEHPVAGDEIRLDHSSSSCWLGFAGDIRHLSMKPA